MRLGIYRVDYRWMYHCRGPGCPRCYLCLLTMFVVPQAIVYGTPLLHHLAPPPLTDTHFPKPPLLSFICHLPIITPGRKKVPESRRITEVNRGHRKRFRLAALLKKGSVRKRAGLAHEWACPVMSGRNLRTRWRVGLSLDGGGKLLLMEGGVTCRKGQVKEPKKSESQSHGAKVVSILSVIF